jgi:cellulose synthase/poly-beta-1,6-N-acetylglucosamine synthase-like glycosyltransferase
MDLFSVLILIILVLGISVTLWSLVGIGRMAHESYRHFRPLKKRRRVVTRKQVAVLIAAHNEELVIAETIASAARLVPRRQIHVVSDASRDATAKIARASGVHTLGLRKNRGKAGALAAGIKRFKLYENYEVILILDADTRLSRDYLRTGLPLFNDPDVVAVAGRALTIDDRTSSTRIGHFLLAYRQRLYTIVQLLMKYGQATRWVNAVSIVPGFASMYRTSALRHINITAPGIIIEDYNMTFDVHAQQLGRIAFHPRAAVAYTQDPDNLPDYINQCKRWSLGFWQAVRYHQFKPTVFWVALLVLIFDTLASSLVLCLLLPIAVLNILSGVWLHESVTTLSGLEQLRYLIFGILIPDYALTLVAAIALRRPRYMLLGVVFIGLRIIDAATYLWACQQAWLQHSSGIWQSPKRRQNTIQPKPAHTVATPKL